MLCCGVQLQSWQSASPFYPSISGSTAAQQHALHANTVTATAQAALAAFAVHAGAGAPPAALVAPPFNSHAGLVPSAVRGHSVHVTLSAPVAGHPSVPGSASPFRHTVPIVHSGDATGPGSPYRVSAPPAPFGSPASTSSSMPRRAQLTPRQMANSNVFVTTLPELEG